MITTGEVKNKNILLVFHAKQTPGKSKLIYKYPLPKYTKNQDSLIKAANFMVDYCLALDKNFELYLDKEMYALNKHELANIESVQLSTLNSLILVSKEERQKKLKAILRVQLFIKVCLAIKNKSKSKIIRRLIYKT